MPGRYGPYVKWGKVNATLPKTLSPETVTLEEALQLVAEKAGKGGKAKATRKPAAAKSAEAGPTAAAKKPAPVKGSAAKGSGAKASGAKKAPVAKKSAAAKTPDPRARTSGGKAAS
jgi:DNA topoisomerase-1